MKLKELADATGLSDAFVSRLERGQVSSSVANLIQIAEALDIGVSELFANPADQLRSDITVHRHGDDGEDQSIPAPAIAGGCLPAACPTTISRSFICCSRAKIAWT